MRTEDQDTSDANALNFWPAFSDFMLAIVLLLVLVMGILLATLVDVGDVTAKQTRLAESILFERQGLKRHTLPDGSVEWRQGEFAVIRFATDPNNPFLQRITFSESVLFDPDNASVKTRGREILRIVGRGIRERIPDIEQIQIHGHADVRPTRRFSDNLELASLRANSVFRFLHREVGIDPVSHLMSSASFAEFVPVDRVPDRPFTTDELWKANGRGADESKMRRNRRIEMLLFYRRDAPSDGHATTAAERPRPRHRLAQRGLLRVHDDRPQAHRAHEDRQGGRGGQGRADDRRGGAGKSLSRLAAGRRPGAPPDRALFDELP